MQSFQELLDAGVEAESVLGIIHTYIDSLYALSTPASPNSDWDKKISWAIDEAEEFIRNINSNERMRELGERWDNFQKRTTVESNQ